MRTALVIVVPEAEPVIGHLRKRYDPAGAMGIPAHVTLLFPFGDEADGLEELFAGTAPFDFELARTARFTEDPVLYLAPEPAEPFVRLIEALASRYPDYPPYDGAHDTIVPHVTVGWDVPEEVDDSLAPSLPVASRAARVTWLEERAQELWGERRRFALGG
jgi:2'-5' RNA ligase